MFIHETAIIYPGVIIEPNVYIGAYCIIGAPAEWKGREDCEGLVLIMSGARLTTCLAFRESDVIFSHN